MRYASHRAVPATAVVLLVVLSLVLEAGAEWIADQIMHGTLPIWIPQFGPAGKTIVTYFLFVEVISSVFVPILVFALGYYYAKAKFSPL